MRSAIRDLIVGYLQRAAAERTVTTIVHYIWIEHHVNPNVTRTTLYRLVQDQQIMRIERGRYAIAAAS